MPQAEAGLNNLYSVLAGIRSMTADYVGHTALALQLCVEHLAWMTDSRRKFICVGEGRFDLCSFGRTPEEGRNQFRLRRWASLKS